MSLNGNPTGAGGIIGETFWLNPNCQWGSGACILRTPQPRANYMNTSGFMKGPPANGANLVFAPGQVGTPVIGVPSSCTSGDEFEIAIEGCDQPDNYTCGMPPGAGGTNAVDLNRNPDVAMANGVSCLIHQSPGSDWSVPNGQDFLTSFAAPSAYPFQIFAGSSNPMLNAGLTAGSPISVSSSIVSLPIYDENTSIATGTTTEVTFVGFLQVFINSVDQFGNVYVTVLNVAGCSKGDGGVGTPIVANSPIPVRLVTPP